jgi:hypothetical protein
MKPYLSVRTLWSSTVGGESTLDLLGAVADWLAAIGTLVAMAAFLFEWRRSRAEAAERDRNAERRAQQEITAAHEHQVRNVSSWIERPNPQSAYEDITGHLFNASDLAIYDVRLTIEDADVEERRLPVIAPSQHASETWQSLKVSSDADLRLTVRFVDAAGRRWWRQDAQFNAEGEG